MPSAREQFFPFLEKKFPRLVRQYREWYERAGYAPESYRQRNQPARRSAANEIWLGGGAARVDSRTVPEFAANDPFPFCFTLMPLR